MLKERLGPEFFGRPALQVAPDLIGRTLYRRTGEGVVAGRLVEVEAYCGESDPASHAYRRVTPRNAIMFGPPGRLYVYFTYGMHHCANVVCEEQGIAGAVLLRAVEPIQGEQIMAHRRGVVQPRLLARGPARLCQAFALTRQDNGADLASGDVWIGQERRLEGAVHASLRVGVPTEPAHEWRFFEQGPWTSGPGRRRPVG
ncbi:MAG: DNA-3-methyladenine glycosylase [Actinomycetota bacterium]